MTAALRRPDTDPSLADEALPTLGAQRNGSTPGLRTFRVLVADDQPEHLEMIARAVGTHRDGVLVEVVRAIDGAGALDAIRGGVDLAFLDIRMPVATGLEVLEAIRLDPDHAGLPVAIISSSTDPRDLDVASRLGVVAYIEKGRYRPFLARIQEVLDAVLKGNRLSTTESAAHGDQPQGR